MNVISHKNDPDFYDKTVQQWWNRCAGDLYCLGQFDAAVCIAGFVHLHDDELSRGFRLLAGLLPEPDAGWRKPLFLRC